MQSAVSHFSLFSLFLSFLFFWALAHSTQTHTLSLFFLCLLAASVPSLSSTLRWLVQMLINNLSSSSSSTSWGGFFSGFAFSLFSDFALPALIVFTSGVQFCVVCVFFQLGQCSKYYALFGCSWICCLNWITRCFSWWDWWWVLVICSLIFPVWWFLFVGLGVCWCYCIVASGSSEVPKRVDWPK